MDRKQTNSVGRDLSRCLSDQDLPSKHSIERENESRADPFRKLSNNSLDTQHVASVILTNLRDHKKPHTNFDLRPLFYFNTTIYSSVYYFYHLTISMMLNIHIGKLPENNCLKKLVVK
jgi:hypothetical protein